RWNSRHPPALQLLWILISDLRQIARHRMARAAFPRAVEIRFTLLRIAHYNVQKIVRVAPRNPEKLDFEPGVDIAKLRIRQTRADRRLVRVIANFRKQQLTLVVIEHGHRPHQIRAYIRSLRRRPVAIAAILDEQFVPARHRRRILPALANRTLRRLNLRVTTHLRRRYARHRRHLLRPNANNPGPEKAPDKSLLHIAPEYQRITRKATMKIVDKASRIFDTHPSMAKSPAFLLLARFLTCA